MSSKLYSAEGIILKRRNIGEADRIITVFTREYGKLRIIAKGVRKITSRRSGHLEVFGQARLTMYRGKTMDHVTEVERLQRYTFPRDNLMKVSFAYYVCELIDRLLPEKQEQDDVYALLEHSFRDIAASPLQSDCDLCVSTFALDTLRLLGFLPPNEDVPHDSIHQYVESIIERKLKTPAFILRTG